MLSLVVASRGFSLVAVLRLLMSESAGSVVGAHRLSCSMACGPGIEPISPALAGRLSTTEPPGKSPPFKFT